MSTQTQNTSMEHYHTTPKIHATFLPFLNKLNSLHKLDKDGADPFSINFLCDDILLFNPTVSLHRG